MATTEVYEFETIILLKSHIAGFYPSDNEGGNNYDVVRETATT